MKTKHYISFLLSLLLGIGTLAAQNRNRLHIPDLSALPGSTLSVPVYVENTTEIVAVQFTLQVPEGSSLTINSAALTNRASDHIVAVRGTGSQEYLCVIYSPTNSAIKGRTGKLMTVDMQVGSSYEEGSRHEFALKDVVLSLRDGSNALSSAEAGTLTITKCPDLMVDNVKADKLVCAPGETLGVSWQVQNIGEVATGDGWTEQISLAQSDGTSVLIGTSLPYNDTLSPSGVVSREAIITLPQVLGLDGNANVQVQLIPRIGTGESEGARGNNIATSASPISIGKQLTLTLPTSSIEENYRQPIRCTLTRSGNRAQEQTFSLSATADSRITIPQEVTIPAGQSAVNFYIQIKDNTVLDEGSLITVTATGNDYEAVSGQITIEDNEYPDLTLTTSKSQVTEGETFQLTIELGRASQAPVDVMLTSEKSRRFTFPSQVIIPAGETSVTVDVVAIDNDEIELKESIAFRASAEKYGRDECTIILYDNDMPTFTFTLSPEAVSESDGYAALFGVIKRTDNLDKRVTLKLSDDSNGLLTYSNQTIVLAKGQVEAQFNIGVTDNDQVDGNHVVNVTAAVYSSSCNCSATGDDKGVMKATITITDDDGPTLRIKPAATAMLEGSAGNVFAISHNTQSNVDVIVRISSDKDDMLEYNHELTIPAGQTTANLLVSVKNNDLQDDSGIATFKVETDGYALGTCWILITDQTLPDAIVSLRADETEAEAEQTVLLHAVVKNVGQAPLPSTTPVEISFSGRREAVELTVGKSVAVGESAVIEYNYDLPAITGNHTFVATVNANKTIPELIYANNTSETVEIKLLSPFSVTAKADKDLYHQGESVSITGKATGSAGKNAGIEVYIINEGVRQAINTTSDAAGNYAISWKPLDKQSGHFIIGACYPGAKETEEMDAFDVYGIRANDNFKTCELNQTETVSGKIIVSNPVNLVQTGLTVTPKAESENCEFTFDVPNSIGAGESVEIGYTIKGNAVSEGRDWQQMPIEISTAEGSHLDYTIYYYVHPLKAKLVTNETFINTTMTFGTPREYSIVIKNVGKGETGKITLSLPNWIQAMTPNEMSSLAQGDSATIVLRFIPTDAMKLNVKINGSIGINCANGDGTAISFNLTPVSETTGQLVVDVVDEYTFNTEEAPHVAGAKVRLRNPSTNAIVAEGLTGEDGTYSVELPEGYYYMTVEADRHGSYSNTVIVDPGIETRIEAFLKYETVITYSWEVVETEIEDEYEIETVVKYETNVPKPVVIVTLPSERPEPYSIIPVVVINKGLVNALDVNLSLSISNGYKLEFLNDLTLEVLAPQQAYVFYAKMLPEGDGTAPECITLSANVYYKAPCQKYTTNELAQAVKRWGNCQSYSGGSSFIGGGGPGVPGLSDNSTYGEYSQFLDIDNPATYCDASCYTVTLSFKQKMTMTRQGFLGTLTVNNGYGNAALENVTLNLEVRDMDDKLTTPHEFQINPKSLDGFVGDLDFTSGWTLSGGEMGVATVEFIPTKFAAPTEPKEYSFGGSFSYLDPGSGLIVTHKLNPKVLTVNPSPELDLTYFMQRDIYGDDPLTEEVEPMEPAEFSLLINNIGYGDATNVRMVTNQPEIIDNEKGLLIDFEILSAQLNGGDKTLALGGSVATDFGTIPARSQAYAQWWLTSSLLGHFTEYDVRATHVTSYGNPDLSLLNEVTIHELIRSIKVDNEVSGFMVNDLPDAEDTPDMVYFTDGTTAEVAVAANATWQKQSNTEYLLTITPSQAGWNYGHITDPTYGRATLMGVRRQSDGKEINLRNFWQTDRTLRDSKDWLYENNLHFVDNIANSTETYLLTFEPRPDAELKVASFDGVPEEGIVLREPLQYVTVTFNKAIDASTFTREDITLYCQGTRVAPPIGITKVSNTTFKLDLRAATASGYYVLTVQTAGIKDIEGFNGASGKTATWVQFININGDLNIDGKVDIADAVAFLDIMACDEYVATADFNHDQKIDIADFVAILDIMAQEGLLHEYVDLGLPSGTLWATCNIGAGSPEEHGFFFAWGETKPQETCSWNTYKYCHGSENTLTKYCYTSDYGYNGFQDTLTELLPEDDAATAIWGSDWQIPSLDQLMELYNSSYTTMEWTSENDVYGCKITSKSNGNTIFLPAAGRLVDAKFSFVGSYGEYWSRTLYTISSCNAYILGFSSRDINISDSPRSSGRTIRPVRVNSVEP